MENVHWSQASEIRLIDEIERQLGSTEWKGPTAINWAALTALGSWPDEENKNALKNRWCVMRKRLGALGDGQVGPFARHVIFDELREAVRNFYKNGRKKRRDFHIVPPPASDLEEPPSESESDSSPLAKRPHAVRDPVARSPLAASHRRWLESLERVGTDTVLAVSDVEIDPCALGRALLGSGPLDEPLFMCLAEMLLAPAIDSGRLSTAGLVQMNAPRQRWVCFAIGAGWTATWDPCGSSSGRDQETRALLQEHGRKVDGHVCKSLPPGQDEESRFLSVLSACLALSKSRDNVPPSQLDPPNAIRSALVSELLSRIGGRASLILVQTPDYHPWPEAVDLLEQLLAPLRLKADVKRARPSHFAEAAANAHHLRVAVEPAHAARSVALPWRPRRDERSFCLIASGRNADEYAPVLEAYVDPARPRVLRVSWAPGAFVRGVLLNGRSCGSTNASLVLMDDRAKLEFYVDRLRVSLTIDGLSASPTSAAVAPTSPRPRSSEGAVIAAATAPVAATIPSVPLTAARPGVEGAVERSPRERLIFEVFGSDPGSPSSPEYSSRGDSFDELASWQKDNKKRRRLRRRTLSHPRGAATVRSPLGPT